MQPWLAIVANKSDEEENKREEVGEDVLGKRCRDVWSSRWFQTQLRSQSPALSGESRDPGGGHIYQYVGETETRMN